MKTDKQLQKEVAAELNWEPSINSAQIGVEAKDGIVTLAGHVRSYAEKWGAEKAAQRVSGVLGVVEELKVDLPGWSKRSDADIARTAESVLQWLSYLPQNRVQVLVENGWITLSGQLEWEYQRDQVVAEVRHLMGVNGIHDHITLKPVMTSAVLKSDIEAALQRRATATASSIVVSVNGADVTLSGTAGNWSERMLAQRTAWSAPGVATVVDNISLTS